MHDLLATTAKFINTTSSPIFLTGKAGTGKTTFLKNLCHVTHKNFIVVAPTGIAALNAGGVTIHSQFLLPPITFLPDRFLSDELTSSGQFLNQHVLARKHPLNSARKQVLRAIDLLVIDEVSMLRADLLDAIDYRLRAARRKYSQPFGDVQVLFIGDLYQLPPVVRNEEQRTLARYYPSAWFYEAHVLRDVPPVYIELDKVFRQSDPVFINTLNNLRNNSTTEDDIDRLNAFVKSDEAISKLEEVITLTTHNYKADDLNKRELQKLTSSAYFFDALIEGEFPESMYPVSPRLELKEGAQIMFIRNDVESKQYYNGKLATVKDISEDEVWVILADTHEPYVLKRERWENKKYTIHETTRDLKEDVIGSFDQYPIKLAWAITVHKSQGLTFDKAIIDVGQAFAGGQVYVALSRLRSLAGLVLRTPITKAVISTDQHVVAFAQANHQPEQLASKMELQQRKYLQELLDVTFDFSVLVNEIGYVQKDSEVEVLADESMKPVLVQLSSRLEQEQTNTVTYRRQLNDLLTNQNLQQLYERLERGQQYYRALLVDCLKLLLEHHEAMRGRKRVKTYLAQLGELDLLLTKKLAEIDKILVLAAGVIRGDDVIDFKEIIENATKERTTLLAGIKRSTPASISKTPRSIAAQKRKSKKKDEPNTVEVSLAMFNQGMSIEEIAKERGLVPSTIEGHLAKAVEQERITLQDFVGEEDVRVIAQSLQQLPAEASSKDLFDALKGKYSYGKLRAVVNHIKKSTG